MALVPGTSSDDIIIPTANGNTYLGGQGNDTYILTKAIAAGGTVVITDTEGANKIQLVDGLTIASSTFFADAAELTLSNGAKVQITGATKFAFDLGANLTAGDTATGSSLNQTYAQFANALGVTTLPTGGASSAGTPNFTVPADPVAATPLFTITGATTGAEGTSVTYTVKLSQAVTTGSTTVNYTTTFLNGASADDITGSGAGTLTFAANETTKTITIPLVADSNAETTKESIVVTLSAPSTGTALGTATAVTTEITEVPVTYTFTGSDAVFEGANATYTVTASRPVDVDTVVGFVVAPGDATAANAGTSKTNLADFDQGAFNTFTATILKGQTTATYTVSALADAVTELEETFSVTASMNGAVVGTKTTTLKDGNGSGGKIFTLTSGVDTGAAFIGTGGPDTFNAFSVGSAEALTAFDSIDGNAGNDTLNVVSAHNAAFTVPSTATVVNIENANITGDNTVTADVTKWTGLTKLAVSSLGSNTVTAAGTTAVTDTAATLGAGAVLVNGGSSVNVTATGSTTGTIDVGTTTAPTGAITVSNTTTGAVNAGAITTNGGTVVSITQAASNAVNTDQTNGTVNVTGGALTTSVTVKASAAASKGATTAGVVANSVSITDVNWHDTTKVGTITSVSADSFTTLSIGGTGVSSLSVANGSGNIIIDNSGLTKNTNTTLALAISGQTGGTLDDADIYTTLNVTTGAKASTLANITDSALTTLTVAGTSGLTLTSTAGLSALKTVTVSGAAGITANLSGATVTSVDTSATTGKSTVTVDAAKATFTGGAGVDVVTLAATTPSKAISLGGGDDTLDLTAITGTPSAAIGGGNGTDTLKMTAAAAATASGSNTFAGIVTGFEGLVLSGATNQTIDLKVLGNFSDVTTSGGNGLTLSNMPTGGKLTLDGAGTAYTIGNSDFTAGTSDVINLTLTDGSGAGVNFASTGITAAGVETIAITTVDTQATPSGVLDLVTLLGNSAKTITVGGNAGLNLTATDTALTSLDASGITLGGFTFTSGALAGAASIKGSATGANTVTFSAATGGAVTYTGGSGADTVVGSNGKNNVITLGDGTNTLTVTGGNNTVTGGKDADTVTAGGGNNTVNLGDGANAFTAGNGNNTYTGGKGVDTVTVGGGQNVITTGTGADVISLTAAPSSGNAYTIITDAAVGDSIAMLDHGAELFNSTKISLAGTAVFQDYLDAAVAGDGGTTNSIFRWFQFGGNTYLVEDNSAAATFQNGTDYVVQLSGLVDLSTATGVGTNVLTIAAAP